jgi:hypothetical protein
MTTEDGRIGRVEGILEEVRTRLNNMENCIDRLESKMQTQFYWLLGVMITMWVTIILAVVFRM